MAPTYSIPCKGIVAYSQEEWKWEELLTREPKEDEMLVEMIATAICHTDISGYGGIYPRVLGHEGAGRVLRLGGKHSSIQAGDLVILSAAACLQCLYCTTGHPAYCVQHASLTLQANEPDFVLASDRSRIIGGGYFGQSSFASPAPVKISSATKIEGITEKDIRLYAPLGCGIMTGSGSITHVGKCGPDDVVAVVGLGGVGLAGICAAKHCGVKNIIAVDRVSTRIELAKELGATHSLLSGPDTQLSTDLKKLTPEELGCTHILDTTPSVGVLAECLEALRNNGMVLQVGVKPVGAKLDLDLLTHMVHGRKLVGVIEGDRDPAEALPELVEWSKNGTLPMKKLTKEFGIQDFGPAKHQMEDGSVIKSVLVW